MLTSAQVFLIRFTLGPILSLIGIYGFGVYHIWFNSPFLEFATYTTATIFGSMIIFMGLPIPTSWIKQEL